VLLASVLFAACGPSFQAAAPPGFVELEDQELYDWRATTADGLVIAVREVEHEPKGTTEFWTRAIENQIRTRGGYALIATKEVTSADGVKGKLLRFGHDEGGKPHIYVIALFVTDDDLYLLEAGGTRELFERHNEQIDWAIKNFRVD
jgi:hypothetical protein